MHEKEKDALALPQAFLQRMQEMLGTEYADFLKSYQEKRTFGLRGNTSKISCEEFERITPFPVKKIPWTENGYFYEEESRPARCPLYQAGLYYLQEPSAMTPASRIPVAPGDLVLDLCAAPGGKATALGAALAGDGLLVANDISASRAKALLRNLELFGISNSLVTSETPEKLAEHFPGFFNRIVLDAPCSGEGMFRKEEALARDWTPEKSEKLAKIQRRLILQAADMLAPGGLLLYSTCTFAPIEDEGVISWLLTERPEMELTEVTPYEGFTPGNPSWGGGNPALLKCVRIFPHKMPGEGHFLALLKKQERLSHKSNINTKGHSGNRKSKTVGKAQDNFSRGHRLLLDAFFAELGLTALAGQPFDWSRLEVRADRAYYLPPVPPDVRGLNFLRCGLYLGDFKKNRFEPAEPFALALRKGDAAAVIRLPAEDPRLTAYLAGNPIPIRPEEASSNGWCLLCAGDYPLAFGKLVNQTLKNKYPAGWRIG